MGFDSSRRGAGWILALGFLLLSACTGSKRLVPAVDGGADTGPCKDGARRCSGATLQVCRSSTFVDDKKCPAACDPTLGCVACVPGQKYCQGDDVRSCDQNGQPGPVITTCKGSVCAGGTCQDPCSMASSEFSYIGCDYYPTVTANSEVTNDSHFAVAVANPNAQPATVTITRPGAQMVQEMVPANGLSLIRLPWVPELKNAGFSALVRGGAYKLNSSLPVTVYQFNPLEYSVDPCQGGQGQCPTFTNDASLLLPSHTLTGHYIAISRPAFLFREKSGGIFGSTDWRGKYPGFITVVGAENADTQVTVKFSAPAMVVDKQSGLYAKGQTQTFTIKQQDVLQIFSGVPGTCNPAFTEKDNDPIFPTELGYCDMPETDLTGTEITADRKVAVFSGHNCTFVPFNRWACDHLEEQMFPLESWGKKYAVAKIMRKPANIPDLIRVVSGADNNTITFTPNLHAPITLNRGQWTEFSVTADVVAEGTEPFALAQFMVGQDYFGMNQGGSNPGDPAMALAVPVEQYRTSYIFLAPETYVENYVNVTAPADAAVMLDGQPIPQASFKSIGPDWIAARVAIKAGTHTIESGKPFGIETYGLAPYTSYMYPGGLDVKQINIQ